MRNRSMIAGFVFMGSLSITPLNAQAPTAGAPTPEAKASKTPVVLAFVHDDCV